MDQYVGKQLGPYQLLEQIGQGGMATIYKAYHAAMDRYVAVKILPGHFTQDETFVARFTQEARTLARLEHPHVLPVHDYGEQEGITYLVMRYIDAGTLKDVVASRGPLDLNEAARILDQVGRALGYAHKQGVIHRDIKPSNVMMDERGDAFLTDFGIAKLVAATSQLTASGAIIGTPAYMSPEQGLGETADLRSDIYSLGVVLYEMVVGKVPFEAETPLAVLLKHINEPLPPPRQVKPDLPESVERVILKAMAKSPDDRFQSTEEMVEAFHQALAAVSQETAAPSEPQSPGQPTPFVGVPLPTEPDTIVPDQKARAGQSVAAPSRRPIPWLAVAGGVAALAVLLIALALVLPGLGGDGEGVPPDDGGVPPESGMEATGGPEQVIVPTTTSPSVTLPTGLAEADQSVTILQEGVRPGPAYSGAADVILRSDFSNVNVGQETYLEVYSGEGTGHSLLRWDLSPLPRDLTVIAASLELFHFEGEADQDMEVGLYRVTRAWAEGSSDAGFYPPQGYVPDGATWLTATTDVTWAAPGGDYDNSADYGHGPDGVVARATLPSGMGREWVRIDVTAVVRAWLQENAPNYGLLLRPLRGGGYHYFYSNDYAEFDLRPRLVVTYTGGVAVTQPALGPGWTSYTNGNFVRALARQGEYLWAGGSGGLVRWNLSDGSYVKFDVGDGLVSNEVNDLAVDAEGNLWVATEEGLNRYDGEAWLTFDRADGLDSDEVETLLVDNDGLLWAGTDGGERGLNIYDGASWGPAPVPDLPATSPGVRLLAMEKNYGLWVGLSGAGLATFDGVEWRVLTPQDGLIGEVVQALFLTEDDALWVGFDEGAMRRDPTSGEWQAIAQLRDESVTAIHQSRDGRFWFGGDEGGARYDPATGDWQALGPRGGQTIDRQVNSIIEDEDRLWLGSEGSGVLSFDGQDWQVLKTEDGLGGNEIAAIRQDGSGALWFAHPGTGLSRYDPVRDVWQNFNDETGALDWPYHPGVDPEGHLWVGGWEELKRFDGRAWQSQEPDQLQGQGTIFAVAFGPDGVAWYSTSDTVIRHDPATGAWQTFGDGGRPALVDVRALYVSGDGSAWAGGDNGLAVYRGGGWRAPDLAGDAPQRDVSSIAEAPDGGLWVVADGSLFQLQQGQWQRFTRPDGGWIEALAVGPDGTVWVGYDGLARFDPSSRAWEVFYSEDGLVNNQVHALHVTPEGVVWVGTAGGVSRFVP